MLVSFQGKTTDRQHRGQEGFLQYRLVKQILSPEEEIKYVMASVIEKYQGCLDLSLRRTAVNAKVLRRIKDANKFRLNIAMCYLKSGTETELWKPADAHIFHCRHVITRKACNK